MNGCFRISLPLIVAMAMTATRAEAQGYGGLLAGFAEPVGQFSDSFDRGFSLRGEAGVSLVLVGVHATAGWSKFGAKGTETKDANVYDAGFGARLLLGPLFIGANGAYFFGHGDKGLGFIPEVGAHLWFAEAILEARVEGDKWWGLKVGIRF